MKKRVDSLARIGKLAARMHELGRWRLSAIQHEQASLSDDLRVTIEALESGDLAYGAQAKLTARRVRALQKRLDALARESDHVERKAHAQGVRAKLAGRAAEHAAQVYLEQKERKELAELVERTIQRKDASQG
jgi:hypothetical protein